MPQTIQCGECSKTISVPDALAGKRVKCPQCGSPVVVNIAPKIAPVVPKESPVDEGALRPESNFSEAENLIGFKPEKEQKSAFPSFAAVASSATTYTKQIRSKVQDSVAKELANPVGKYPEILKYSNWVLRGAGIVGWTGFGVIFEGVCTLLWGLFVYLFYQNDSKLAAGIVGGSYFTEGIEYIVAGVLIVAFAAFFKLICYTCLAVREHIVMAQTTHQPTPVI